jgi:hypothetical protein
MTKPRGTDVVTVIQRLLDEQTLDAQQKKQDDIAAVLGAFAKDHGIPAHAKAFTTLAKLLRNNDSETVRQVRSMSDALLLKDERELGVELGKLREGLSPIEATFHQVKTKNAFIYTVLRPFSPKFTARWFSEREDIDGDLFQETIQRLEAFELTDVADLTPWVEGVSTLFEQLVVYRGEDADNFYARPAGTVSLKSGRTYLQAWIAFTKREQLEIWSLLTLGERATNKTKDQISRNASEDAGFDQYAPSSRENSRVKSGKASRNKGESSFSMMMAPPAADRDFSNVSMDLARESVTVNKSRGASKPPQVWVEIFIESKLDSSAQATRRWESSADFRMSIQKWLDTFPVIWGPAADQFIAKVSVRNNSGQSDLTLPSLTANDAAKRITQAVEMQSE